MDSNEKELKRLQEYVDRVNELEAEFEKLTDEELKARSAGFKEQIKKSSSGLGDKLQEAQANLAEARKNAAGATWDEDKDEAEKLYRQAQDRINQIDKEQRKLENEALDEILPEAFAAVREAGKRTIGQRAFDVQLLGATTLHQGKIAEMRTGEGKTLTATFPLYLNALTGRGAHLVTVNDYLARFHAYWMGPIFQMLGISVAAIYPMQNPDEQQPARLYDPEYDSGKENDPWRKFLKPVSRREAYAADVTYGTASEFGFDYLRDNMVADLSQCVQRPLYYAIVDEVDNLLIDEARTPLIISAPDKESGLLYQKFAQLASRLRREEDYDVKEKEQSADLNEAGWDKVEGMLHRDGMLKAGESLYTNGSLMHHLRNALSAKEFYRRDQRYVVENGEVIIVDEFTGRKMYGRRYSEGLHQAIEAKEHIRVQEESKTYATVTIQNYFRMYDKLAGMTGTALTEAEEFYKIYKLDVTEIPTHKPMIREDFPDQVYKTEEGKYRAVVREIKRIHETGAPILIGTVSIENSVRLSDMLKRQGIPCQVLNAKEHTREAQIVATAGEPKAVTVATNMAGRGVDIILGGRPSDLSDIESIDQYIHRKLEEFQIEALSILKNENLNSQWLKQYEENIAIKAKKIKEINQSILKIKKANDEGNYDDVILKDENIDELKRIVKPCYSEYIISVISSVNEIEEKLHQKYKELEQTEEHGILQKIKDLLGIKNPKAGFKEKIETSARNIEEFLDWIKKRLLVIRQGGLHIIGTERHEARRIDNQLRGRAGRQGDPGSSRFFVSLEDDIMKRFGGDRLKTVMGWVGLDEDTPIENKLITNAITDVQKRVEGYHFDVRKNLVEFDDVANKHRELIYEERRKIMGGADLKTNILKMAADEVREICGTHEASNYGEEADLSGLLTEIKRVLPLPPTLTIKFLEGKKPGEIEKLFLDMVNATYEQREKDMGEEKMRLLERLMMLQVMDRLWVEHLTAMESMRMQASWQTLRQVRSVDAYKNAGYQQFQTLLETIKHDVAAAIFHVAIVDKNPNKAPQSPITAAGIGSKGDARPLASKKIGRNDPCPCGSGKKYKHCHGK